MAITQGNVTLTRVTVGSSATALAALDATRRGLLVINPSASAELDLGDATVTSSNGIPVAPNYGQASFNGATAASAAWYGAIAGGGVSVCVVEIR